MVSRYLDALGWAWIACLSIVGAIVAAAPNIEGLPPEWFSDGIGVALQLIAAGIIFAAAFPTLARNPKSIVAVAGMLTAVFGYLGTMMVLYDENQILLVFVLLLTLYPVLMTSGLLFVALFVREVRVHF